MNTIPATLGPSLADVMAQIEADEGLKATRRRDLCSALRRLSVVLDRPLEGLPASASQLRPLLNGSSLPSTDCRQRPMRICVAMYWLPSATSESPNLGPTP
jgi:hypothetical protein